VNALRDALAGRELDAEYPGYTFRGFKATPLAPPVLRQYPATAGPALMSDLTISVKFLMLRKRCMLDGMLRLEVNSARSDRTASSRRAR
jgi:hypothetical protein